MAVAVDPAKRLGRAIHAEVNRRKIDDDTYRDILKNVAGASSSKKCSIPQLKAVLAAVKGKSYTPSRPKASSPYIQKARALWLSLYNLGEIDDPSDKALTSFARRQLKIDALQWATPEVASSLIEPLRAMCERAGFVTASNVKRDEAMNNLIMVQLDRLFPEGVPETLRSWAASAPMYDVSNQLGEMIRKRKADQ